ncbi:MAG TPA: cytochrome b/b6 domain-containing protein [Vicinamibacterales bacterium]
MRFVHWTNATAVCVMLLSGLQIFSAFPSFGAKVPEHDLIEAVPEAVTLGGWLGGALQWHFTFMWIFAIGGIFYVSAQLMSGHFRTVLFVTRDAPGVWPMARHYFLFGPKPPITAQYNALQKLAYTTALLLGGLLMWTGAVMYKPAQLSLLAAPFGGYHNARLVHFLAMCGLVAFVPGHLVMVAIHGWDNARSIVTGWKRHPEYETVHGIQAADGDSGSS